LDSNSEPVNTTGNELQPSGKLDAERQCGRRVFEIPVETDKVRQKILDKIADEITKKYLAIYTFANNRQQI
jgi:hypothetical protein